MMSLSEIQDAYCCLEETLKCPICSQLLNEPVVSGKCGHTICKQCHLDDWDIKCPVCKLPIFGKDFQEDKQIKELLFHLKQIKQIIDNANGIVEEDAQMLDIPNLKTSLTDKNSNVSVDKSSISLNENKSNACASVNKQINFKKSLKLKRSKFTQPNFKSKYKIKNIKDSSLQLIPNQDESPNSNTTSLKQPSLDSSKLVSTLLGKEKILNSSTLDDNSLLHISPNNLEKRNHKGETPLHNFAIKGDLLMVKKLLELGAKPNLQDNNGWTPLHEACNHGYLEIAKLLIEHGALINVPGDQNIMPIHDALIAENFEIAKFLASKGADLYIRTSKGYSALDLCQTEEMKQILKETSRSIFNLPISLAKTSNNNKQLVFLSTSLNENQQLEVKKCAQLLNGEYVNDFKSEVTHIITACGENGCCIRTIKIFKGLLSGKWILNYSWIEKCLQDKKICKEEDFEITGLKPVPNTLVPKIARENKELQKPPLFNGFKFYLHGNFTRPLPENKTLVCLIQLGGGIVLHREPRLDMISTDDHMIPFHANNTALQDFSYIILYQDKPPRGIYIKDKPLYTIPVNWIIQCMSVFKILDPKSVN